MMTAQQTVGDVGALRAPPFEPPRQLKDESRGEADDEQQQAGEDGGDSNSNDEDKKEEEAAAATAPSKKSRRELPPHTVAILKGWMLSPEHVKHPYPTDEDKQMLLKKTGINMKQLTNWFTNARKRIWKPMMRREHSRQLQTAIEMDKSRARELYPGGPLGPYNEAYGPRVVRHSFDAGSLGVPRDPHAPYDQYARHPAPPVAGVQGYPQSMLPQPGMYPPRAIRSMSEAPARSEMDDYINVMQIRKRLHDRDDSGAMHGDYEPTEKRMRTSMSPRGLKILQDWVNARAHTEYPFPDEAERNHLSHETGLDVDQLDAWIKSLHERAVSGHHGYAPPPVGVNRPNLAPAPQRSIPGRDNPLFPRRSIPAAGNSMFPPRPITSTRSIPSAGNPQFPPPPAARRDGSDGDRNAGYYPSSATQASAGAPGGYPASSSAYPAAAADSLRGSRSLSISAGQYLHPPPPTPTGQQAPPALQSTATAGGLPSLSSRNLLSRPVSTPTMGQPRDSRSHTLDMSQFADARRRRMNFQDILASAKDSLPPPQPSGHMMQGASNVENVYPNAAVGSYPPPTYESQQQKSVRPSTLDACDRCSRPSNSCVCRVDDRVSDETGSTRIV